MPSSDPPTRATPAAAIEKRPTELAGSTTRDLVVKRREGAASPVAGASDAAIELYASLLGLTVTGPPEGATFSAGLNPRSSAHPPSLERGDSPPPVGPSPELLSMRIKAGGTTMVSE